MCYNILLYHVCNYRILHFAGKKRPSMIDINNHVVPNWAPKWKHLGAKLNIQQHLMDIIEHNHPNDCETCCSEMLSEWLDNNPGACWEDIITAVDNLSSGMNTCNCV